MFISKKKEKELEEKIDILMKNQSEQNKILLQQIDKIEQIEDNYDGLVSNDLEAKTKSSLYPSKVEIFNDICGGRYSDGRTLYDSENAVKLVMIINNAVYPKNEVLKSVKEICQKVIECFC